MLGNSGVGKSSIIIQYTYKKFYFDISSNAGVDNRVKVVKHEGKTIKLFISDTCGQEKYRSVASTYFRGAQGMVFVFSL